jgi:hypothetical protein
MIASRLEANIQIIAEKMNGFGKIVRMEKIKKFVVLLEFLFYSHRETFP